MLVEVFKFFSGEDIALNLAVTCKEFYSISWEEEVWRA
jgi:hypothetical protein